MKKFGDAKDAKGIDSKTSFGDFVSLKMGSINVLIN